MEDTSEVIALDRLALLDFEASCAPERGRSYPISVAVAHCDTGVVREWLIRPESDWAENWDWYYEAELLHGISRERLLREGRPRADAAPEVIAMLDGRDVLSDAPDLEQYWLNHLVGNDFGPRVSSFASRLREIAGGGPDGLAAIKRAHAHARRYAPKTHRAGDDVGHMLAVLRHLAVSLR